MEGKVEELLAPYDEDLEVPEHRLGCHCVGSLARRDVRERLDSRFGNIDEFRQTFWETVAGDGSALDKWGAFMAPVVAAEEELMRGHPLRDEPAPACSHCDGTGEFPTTYNPQSKWDWWIVGGRWAGVLRPACDPARDPVNLETCRRCGGKGIEPSDHERRKSEEKAASANPRRLIDGEEPQEESPREIDAGLTPSDAACVLCEGRGRAPKFQGDWTHEDDVIPAARLLCLLGQDIERHCPFAAVTPDGEWHEHGRMGWFALVSDEKPKDEWRKRVMKVVRDHVDCLAVVCDLHI